MHWYTIDGQPNHDVGMKVAREKNLLPSVTTILNDLRKPFLENWMVRKAVETSYKFNKSYYGNTEDYVDDILAYCNEDIKQAPEFGSIVHSLIHRYCIGRIVDLTRYDQNTINAYKNAVEWIRDNVKYVIASEKALTSKLSGYAGTIDLIAMMKDGTIAIVDFKTQGSKHKKCGLKGYKEWTYQLAAYKMLYAEYSKKIDVKCIALVLSSDENESLVCRYSDELMQRSTIVFYSALNIFRYSRNFLWTPVCDSL